MRTGIYNPEVFADLARRAQAEGVVMLENRDGALPLAKGSRVALFGRSQFHYYKSGTGSGGMVNTDHVTGVREAILAREAYVLSPALEKAYGEWLPDHPFEEGAAWGAEPWFQEEMVPDEETVRRAAQESDAAIVIIGRTAGEDRDNAAEPGSWLLTDKEEALLERVCGAFARTIVLLNVGNIIDMKWVARYNPAAVLYIWQGGQEGGDGVLDVLLGDVSPSGKLADTIARDIEDYPSTANFGASDHELYAEDIYVGYRYFETFAPERVLYPFGYGLSYTEFLIEGQGLESITDDMLIFRVRVHNTGTCPGREVVQVYCEAPQGKLGKPARVLCSFRKTILLDPGQSQDLRMKVPVRTIASYDDSGVTGFKSAWVLEEGTYNFHLGSSVRDTKPCGNFSLSGTAVIEQLEEAMAPVAPFERMRPVRKSGGGEENSVNKENGAKTENGGGAFAIAYEPVPLRTAAPLERRAQRLPADYPFAGDRGFKLKDVGEGRITMEEFLSQLTQEDLICLTRGEGMCSPRVTPGTASAFGGVTDRLVYFGIPAACCSDGPSGIRLDSGLLAFSVPSGTCLACTFNVVLVKELFDWVGMELRMNRIDSLLGPGMNIHRNPLGGRNFEYFSEDPFLTGRMATVQLRGMRESGIASTIKHFCANNREHRRFQMESVVSERALREIYLRGFEIAVREGAATSVMTTYGAVNGAYTASQYDLLTTILRGQFGFGGIVMTDWGACGSEEGGEASQQQTGSMIRAQNDLYMVTEDAEHNANGDDTAQALAEGRLTRGELLRSAANICRYLLDTPAFLRLNGYRTDLDIMLDKCRGQAALRDGGIEEIRAPEGGRYDFPAGMIRLEKGRMNAFAVHGPGRGHCALELEVRLAEGQSIWQLPLSVIVGREPLVTKMVKGDGREWTGMQIDLPEAAGDVFELRLFAALPGLEIRSAALIWE